MRSVSPLAGLLVGLAFVAGCSQSPADAPDPVVNGTDPYLARALNEPLMIDPDLAWMNEANAAITIGHDHALPSFKGSDEAASRARETARLELLEDGPIPELPLGGDGPASLAEAYGVDAVLDAVEAPRACRRDIRGSFAYAASMPDHARIMPHGMVRLAAAVERPGCSLRIVRYVIPASIEDALQYHYTLASRANMDPAVFAAPEAGLVATRRGRTLKVFARPTSGELTAIDLVIWET
jgi:hypothetical protein